MTIHITMVEAGLVGARDAPVPGPPSSRCHALIMAFVKCWVVLQLLVTLAIVVQSRNAAAAPIAQAAAAAPCCPAPCTTNTTTMTITSTTTTTTCPLVVWLAPPSNMSREFLARYKKVPYLLDVQTGYYRIGVYTTLGDPEDQYIQLGAKVWMCGQATTTTTTTMD